MSTIAWWDWDTLNLTYPKPILAIHKMVPQKSLTFYFQGVWRGEHYDFYINMRGISQCFFGSDWWFWWFYIFHILTKTYVMFHDSWHMYIYIHRICIRYWRRDGHTSTGRKFALVEGWVMTWNLCRIDYSCPFRVAGVGRSNYHPVLNLKN